MTEAELTDALNGLHAYDEGATDSGIYDERLRARCITYLKAKPLRPGQLLPDVTARIMRELYLTDEAIARGYGVEDAVGFARWLGERMEMPKL